MMRLCAEFCWAQSQANQTSVNVGGVTITLPANIIAELNNLDTQVLLPQNPSSSYTILRCAVFD